MFIVAFTLVDFFVTLGLGIVLVAVLVAVGKSAADKATQRALGRIVKPGCTGSNRGQEAGELTQLTQSMIDVLTQGFTLETVSAEIVWRKTKKGVCRYKIVTTGQDENGKTSSKESQEFDVPNCPA